jgi:hypothetical protein
MAAIKPNLNWEQPSENPKLAVAPSYWATRFIDPEDTVIMRICKTTHAQQLAEAARDQTKRDWKDIVPEELHEHEFVFSEEVSKRFPEPKQWDHAIDLLEGALTVLDCKVYPLTQDEQIALDKFLTEHLDKGYIRPSNSPYAAPFFFIRKKDGKLQPIQDYRQLNTWTRKNHYPLPLIAELVE